MYKENTSRNAYVQQEVKVKDREYKQTRKRGQKIFDNVRKSEKYVCLKVQNREERSVDGENKEK